MEAGWVEVEEGGTSFTHRLRPSLAERTQSQSVLGALSQPMPHAGETEELPLSHEEVPPCCQCLGEEQEEEIITELASMPAAVEEGLEQVCREGHPGTVDNALATLSKEELVVARLMQVVVEGSERVKPRLDQVNMGCNIHTLAPASTTAREGVVVVVVPILRRSVEMGTEGTAVVATRLIMPPIANHTDGMG